MFQNYIKWQIPCLIGIDIRQNFFRLVELCYANNTYHILNCIHLKLPSPPLNSQAIIKALKIILQQNAKQTPNIAIALSHAITLQQEYSLETSLAIPNLRDFIEYKITTENAFSKEQFSFTYQTLPSASKQTGNTVQIIAAPKQHILYLVKLFHKTQCHLQVIDLDIYALARALRWQLYQQKITETVILINIDNAHLLMLILEHTQIMYHHEEFLLKSKCASITYIAISSNKCN